MKYKLLVALVILVVLAGYVNVLAQEPTPEHFVYLSIVSRVMNPLPTPTATYTPIWRPTIIPPTNTPRPTGVAK